MKWALRAAGIGAAILALGTVRSASADDGDLLRRLLGPRAVKLLATIPVPGLTLFDTAVIEARTQRYFLADRSNNAIDVIDARRNVFLKQIQSGGFRGATGDSDTSGPNGITVSGNFLFVADAPSRVVSIDLRTDQIVGEVSTGGAGANRADELAFDPDDGVLAVVNNIDTPPFVTLIDVNQTTGALAVTQRISFQNFGPRHDTATNEVEQVAFSRRTGKFYVAVPEVNGPGGGGTHGAIAVIDPTGDRVERTFPVDLCQPAGLAVGPGHDLLLGCGVIFDSAGVACGEPSATQAIDCNGRSARPTQLILDVDSGEIEREIVGLGGSDQVTFNPGDQRYFTASRDNPLGPVLGIIDARREVLDQIVPTFNTPLTAPDPQGSAKSVAVNPRNDRAFVALPANNVFPGCLTGCVAVFGAPRD